jgi:glycine/D-amino acid oxidase-like deaminating enzyme
MSLSRREFLKVSAAAAGGLLLTAAGASYLLDRRPKFDPNESYWAQAQPAPDPPLQRDLQADIAIIGGGYTGLSAAYHLARKQPEARIVLLEARQVGHGASGRNGAMVLPHTGPETMQITGDPEMHKWIYDVTVGGMRDLARLVRETGVDCDLRLDGYHYVIAQGEDIPYYRDYLETVNALGMPLQFFNRLETEARLGTRAFWGSVYDPNGGQVHPMKLTGALKAAAESRGVQIFGNSPVIEIEEGETLRLRVGDAGYEVRAGALVLATNGYTSHLGWFRNRVIPVHTQCAATAPLTPDQLAALKWESGLPFYDSRYLLYHLVLTPEKRIVIGGGKPAYCFADGLHYCGDLDSVADGLLAELRHLYPALEGVRFERVWDGVLGVSYDEYESVGVTGEYGNIYYGLAYNGHGINLSFLFGKIIADLHAKTASRWEEMPFVNYPLPKFPPEPLKWVGAKGYLAYYEHLDETAR